MKSMYKLMKCEVEAERTLLDFIARGTVGIN